MKILLQISKRAGGGKVTNSCKFIIGKHLKMLLFKFQQNRTINEEFLGREEETFFNFLGREEERGPHY